MQAEAVEEAVISTKRLCVSEDKRPLNAKDGAAVLIPTLPVSSGNSECKSIGKVARASQNLLTSGAKRLHKSIWESGVSPQSPLQEPTKW